MGKILPVIILAAAAALSRTVTVQDIDGAIRWLVRGVPSNPMTDPVARQDMSKAVHAAAIESDLDPYLLTVLAYRESSFRSWAVGSSRGEIGVIQVHGHPLRECKRDGLDMTRTDGQLRCGARYLRALSNHCGDVTRGLTAYACGRCEAPTDKIAREVASRLRLAHKLASKPWKD